MLNKVILIGRVTKDIQLQTTKQGKAYARFTVAIGNGKNKDGTDRPANFITCVAWEKRAENLSVYVHKGNKIVLEGKWIVEVKQDEMGNNKYYNYLLIQNMEFLESKSKNGFVPQKPTDYSQQQFNEKVDPFQEMAIK